MRGEYHHPACSEYLACGLGGKSANAFHMSCHFTGPPLVTCVYKNHRSSSRKIKPTMSLRIMKALAKRMSRFLLS